MFRLRLAAQPRRADEIAAALGGRGGVRRLVRAPAEGEGDQVVVSADLTAAATDDVMGILRELAVPDDDYLIYRVDVIAPSLAATARQPEVPEFSWIEVMGEARAHARPLGRYLALMCVAAVVAGLGVIESNAILIVGAMAVSPDLLPVCATCVGIVGRRWLLARRAFATLAVGLLLVIAVTAALTALLDLTGSLAGDFRVGEGGIGALIHFDYSTVLVALAAGVAAMLAFETRASAAVGVAISVTTIPASAYIGVAVGTGELDAADGAAVVLAVNVAMLMISGSLTLVAQRWVRRR